MKRYCPLLFLALMLAANLGRGQNYTVAPKLLASFESLQEIQSLKLMDASVKLAQEHVTEGRMALEINFQHAARPSVRFPSDDKAWNWAGYGALAFDLANPSGEDVRFSLRIEDAVGESVQGRAVIGPRQSLSFSFLLGSSAPMEHGMRGGPRPPGTESSLSISTARLNEERVAAFELYLDHPSTARTLFLDNVRLLPPVSYDGLADTFGQYARADWPGKIKNPAELASRRDEEEAQIKAAPALPDRDEYGGWASGWRVETTGFFGTTKHDGKWWLVTPTGHLFFSLGVDVITPGDGFTLLEGREKMFTWLPAADDPLAKHFGQTSEVLYGPIKKGRTFNSYTANLERKYGAGYLERWRAFALDRLRAWGFNTVGNWSDPALYGLRRVPYVATLEVRGDYARVASGNDYWGKMPDPFDPKFAVAAGKSFRDTALELRDDPWCLGYFVDNELSWGSVGSDAQHYGLAYGALAGSKDSPAKQAFVEQLKLHYGQVKNLSRAWRADFASWDTLLARPYTPSGSFTPQRTADFSSFLKIFAEQYFRVVRDTLKQFDPNHLYLGCRFAWRTPEAVAAGAEYCDVLSFNVYRPRLAAEEWDFANSLGRPCIIGEFHFGALDRGLLHPGLVAVPDQKARAQMYQDYIRSVVDHPAFVGCHWFQYYDEPLTGRTYDGENYNIGFVTVTDTPYPEMVEAAKTIHAQVYARRSGH